MAGRQDTNSWFLRNKEQILRKSRNKRFPLYSIAITVWYCLLIGWWKVKSYTTSGSYPPLSQRHVQGFVTALQLWTDAPFVTASLSTLTLNTPFLSTFLGLILSHGAVCSSSHRPFRKKTVLHPTLLHGEGITVREQTHFQSVCDRLSPVTHTGHGIISWN